MTTLTPTRTVAIASTAWDKGIRVYSTCGNAILEDCLDQEGTHTAAGRGKEKNFGGWYHGATLPNICAPWSALCCISWRSTISLFYQTEDTVIREMRYDGSKWSVSTFAQVNALRGTAMAAVFHEDANRLFFFFQDLGGDVLCRYATNSQWEPAVRVCKARPLTAMAAVQSHSLPVLFFVYCQQTDLSIHQCVAQWPVMNVWSESSTQASTKVFSSMAGICTSNEFRVYVQPSDNSSMWILSRSDFGNAIDLYAHHHPNVYPKNNDCSDVAVRLAGVTCQHRRKRRGQIYLHAWEGGVDTSTYTLYPLWAQRRICPNGYSGASQVTRTCVLQMKSFFPPAAAPTTVTLSVPDLAGIDLPVPTDPSSSSHPPNPTQTDRPMAIAATGWTGTVRVYTQCGDGEIWEGSYDPHVVPWDPDLARRVPGVSSQLDLARRQIHGWRRNKLPDHCASWSMLCCRSWTDARSIRNVSVVYQTTDNILHEMQHDGQNWNTTSLTHADAMPGTAMAEVSSHRRYECYAVFFQDTSGFLCYRLATSAGWATPAARICHAATWTPIAATWARPRDTNEARLYFQDTLHQVREFAVTFQNNNYRDGVWALKKLKLPGMSLGSMSATPWNTGAITILYMQAKDNSIREVVCHWAFDNGRGYRVDETAHLARPSTGVAAFYIPDSLQTNIYWASSDKTLRQRLKLACAWQTIDAIGDLSTGEPLGLALVGPLTPEQLCDWARWFITDLRPLENRWLSLVSQWGRVCPEELKPYAEAAISHMNTLAVKVVQIFTVIARDQSFDDLVDECVTQSDTVSEAFDTLYYRAFDIVEDAANLATEAIYQQSTVQSRMKRIGELRDVIEVLIDGQKKALEMGGDEYNTAAKTLGTLEAAKRAAEDKDENIKLRIVRNVLTLGLGESGDLGDLNAAIKRCDQLIADCKTQIATGQAAKKEAWRRNSKGMGVLQEYWQLDSDLKATEPVLQFRLESLTGFATQIVQIENKALDIGLGLSALLGKASILPTQHTAAQLASNILDIQRLLKTDNRLTVVFVNNPAFLESSLKLIAKRVSEINTGGLV
ncbi:Jacalin-type lectin domain-containing protein [Mycena venus]|uniref:Jacalin-type lectin domain-containing protein n=1 Tax=Mycena venus TaxID=2733690 RepID=A0A8H6XLZ8_9AGAR|nr:Jacalin-type lectin domain-containing protein [Mycena venus]